MFHVVTLCSGSKSWYAPFYIIYIIGHVGTNMHDLSQGCSNQKLVNFHLQSNIHSVIKLKA